ncbi:M24 family metallopeptidase [Planctomicrobium sp. SH661]|uniref:M24 family metallopeptidase n=1 Tax=Planctomicrobium sp. SH661 TaxID=3448124 RepID=UPI003F5CB8DB
MSGRSHSLMNRVPEMFQRRRNLLRKSLRVRHFDAALIQSEKNVAWLTGFSGDSTWLLLTQDSQTLISDFRFVTQLEEECPGVSALIRPSSVKLSAAVADLVGQQKIERLGFEGQVATFELVESLRGALPGIGLESFAWEVEALRVVKDREEIAEIKEAVRLAERGFQCFQSILTPDSTERQLAAELEHALRRFGARGLSFPAIVAVGDRSALPHYRAGNRRLSESPILLLDWGAVTQDGYCSDLTRTMLTGKPDRKFEKVYKTVLEAQVAAIDRIAPGVTCGEVDAVARDIIQAAGFGKYFDHGLGHGIGLDVHEAPRLSRKVETVLQPGMVVTVEPGIYLPGWGGVRIEDDILVTKQGREVLSSLPKDWDHVTVSL